MRRNPIPEDNTWGQIFCAPKFENSHQRRPGLLFTELLNQAQPLTASVKTKSQ